MRVYVTVCFAENEETNHFTDFADVVGVYILKNHAEEVAKEYEETQHDKYLGCNNYRVIKIVNVKEK